MAEPDRNKVETVTMAEKCGAIFISMTTIFKRTYRAEVFSTLVVSLCSVGIGFNVGFTSPSTDMLTSQGSLRPSLTEWYESFLPLGAMFGSMLAGYTVEEFGRKTTLAISTSFSTVGFLFIIINADETLLLLGRLLCGFSTGLVLFPMALYIGETARPEVRGLLISFLYTTLKFGIFLIFVVSYFISLQWYAILCSGVATLSLTCLLFIPETPAWYLNHDREAEAREALMWLRQNDKDLVENQLKAMKQSIFNQSQRRSSLLALFRERRLRLPLILTLVLQVFQQFVGAVSIDFNIIQIFQAAGIQNELLAIAIINILRILASVVGAMLMDIAGRRVLLTISGSTLVASLVVLGLTFYLQEVNNVQSDSLKVLSIACLVVYYIAYSIGWSPVPIVIMGEIFPPSARFVAGGLCFSAQFFFSFVVTLTFLPMQRTLHIYGSFWFYAASTTLGTILAVALMPETKGRSLEIIELYFK